MTAKKTRSPLKDSPLRNPGQSLDEQIDNIINEKALNYMLTITLAVLFAAIEWCRWALDVKPSPWLYTIIASIVIPYAGWKLRHLLKQLKNLKLGRDGERSVGQFLDQLRESGCHVFHDIVANNFNIDHVVVSEKGLFLIETKTYSKPMRGEPSIKYDGEKLSINGREPDRNPVVQAKSSARWIQDYLQETTGKRFPVKPVVLFPGWFIRTTVKLTPSDVWVLEPKAFPKFLANERNVLHLPDVHLAKSRIGKYIRDSNKRSAD